MDDKEQTRQKILAAAGRRFQHYGYAKTTMSEIAADLKMSTGNLYRFFPSKLDIAEAYALAHESDEEAMMASIGALPKSAAERLIEHHRALLDYTFTMIDESQKIFELAQAIGRERPSYVNRRLANERVYLSSILKDGIEDGLFAPNEDINRLAEMIQCATMKFRYPQLHNCFSLDTLRRELEGTMDLIFKGLIKR
ncbi:TetR/AcrR family transcriptional regulator [Candidatus Phycosocius spiralis]|nr:TetR/AcrR family transcriptional regulator [Candidatus Phycosocius spiralis]